MNSAGSIYYIRASCNIACTTFLLVFQLSLKFASRLLESFIVVAAFTLNNNNARLTKQIPKPMAWRRKNPKTGLHDVVCSLVWKKVAGFSKENKHVARCICEVCQRQSFSCRKDLSLSQHRLKIQEVWWKFVWCLQALSLHTL